MKNDSNQTNSFTSMMYMEQRKSKILMILICVLMVVLLTTELCYAKKKIGGENNELKAGIDAAIESAIEEERIVGTVVVVMRNGKMVYRRAAGFADREEDRPMQVNEIFRLASVSKPIVTVAALRLIDKGRLNLDDPVTQYLPDFQPQLEDGSTPDITIKQLLTHTAGLSYGFLEPSDGPYHQANVSDGMDQPGLSMEEELSRIVTAGLAYEPGTNWGYSVAIDVLGAVIEEVTQTSLHKAVKRLVTRPAGMVDTAFSATDSDRLAVPYADGTPPVLMIDPYVLPFLGLAGISFSPSRVFDSTSFPSGGAGMIGTAEDIAKLLEIVRSGGGKLLKLDTVRAMLTNQIGDFVTFYGPGWSFGYGGALVADPEAAGVPYSQGTWSWAGVYGHNWFVDLKLGLVVVIMTNTAVEGMSGQFPDDVRDAVYEQE
ncbi:MAG: serine hydrolase domain-containing protein [Desulfobacteraceae bacterium]|jgi:CubicO group peptidase (beta-lactamase class C family)